ncbi:hypothetical protein ACIOD2_27225 [Amycolatopsis sp. NPDC088138]|uniref:hypothetical protein n=1 Tax=Amycolatopsis sp. NPDC088138 TaxID=3363938 RepID=UPI00380AFC5C
MTAPASAIPVVIVEHDGEALSLEDAAAIAAAGPVRDALKSALSWAHVTWSKRFGKPAGLRSGEDFDVFTAELAARIRVVGIDPAPVLLDFAQRARVLGVSQGLIEAGAPQRQLGDDIREETRKHIADAVDRANAKLAEAADRVENLKRGSFKTINRQLAVADQVGNIVERTARTVTNDELNEGLAAAAEHVKGRLVWIAERDACVMCLALSGHVVEPGDAFDWRLTFGSKAYQPRDYDESGELVDIELERPPRHPYCRCRVSPWLGHDEDAARAVTHDWAEALRDAEAKGDTVAADAARRAAAAASESAVFDLPAALRREAERSVLNGYALPTESERVRVQAADRLLNRIGTGKNSRSPSGWRVPASVRKRAERALLNGTFATRSVPTGRK